MSRYGVTEHVVVLTLVAALGCAGRAVAPPAPGPSTLDDLLHGDLAADHAFAWSARRRLAWSDFQGSPPSEGSEGAKTSYTLYSGWKCRGDVFESRVIAGFRPRQSWVKAIVLNDSAQRRSILRHEQTHFDLVEVHARRMRSAFRDLAHPCTLSDTELSAMAERFSQEEKAEQRRYDDETNHGLLADKQAGWNAAVARRLAQ